MEWIYWLMVMVPVAVLGVVKAVGTAIMAGRMRGVEELALGEEEREEVQRLWGGALLLVLVNPLGGNGAGLLSYRRCVEPTLKGLGIGHVLVLTERKGHAREVVERLPAESPYEAVLCVGGDGLVHEALNGLMLRRGALGLRPEDAPALCHIPAGTGNGIAVGLGLGKHPAEALRRALKKGPAGRMVDVIRVRQEMGDNVERVEWSLMSFNYGLVAEGDNLTENTLRWTGWLRELLAPVYLLARARRIRGRLSFEPAEAHFGPQSLLGQLRFLDGLQRDEEGRCVLEGPVFYLIGSSLSHIAHDIHCTPLAAPDDGCLDALLQTSNDRLSAVSLFLSADKGVSLPALKRSGARYLKMRSVSITPIDPPCGSPQVVFSTDGEILPTAPTTATVLPSACRVIA